MSDKLLISTMQSAALSAISNVLAQLITAYRDQKPYSINVTTILQFVLLNLLNTPPNVLWQQWLEDTFPGRVKAQPDKPKKADAKSGKKDKQGEAEGGQLNVRNTAIKFGLDQTLGAWGNTLMFLGFLSLIRGYSLERTWNEIQSNFWSVQVVGWKMWPLVSIISFSLVPLEHRVLFGSLAGLVWGIILSIRAG